MKPATTLKHLPHDSILAHIFSKHDDDSHSGFISRLDRTPVSQKKLAFVSGIIYNFLILVASTALLAVVISRGTSSHAPGSLRLTLSITQGVLLSWAIYILLRTTSVPFIFGECRVRWKYGFRSAEVVIRRSPINALPSGQPLEHYWRASVRAINPTLLYSNPVSMFASDFWVMEHAIILDVCASLSCNDVNEEDLEFTLWKEHCSSWTGLELWRMPSIASDRQEVALFKAFLTEKGKHELLSTWEQTFQDRKTPSVQTSAKYQLLVKRFSQEGIDYETVWSRISKPH